MDFGYTLASGMAIHLEPECVGDLAKQRSLIPVVDDITCIHCLTRMKMGTTLRELRENPPQSR